MDFQKMCSDFQNHGLKLKFIPISKPTTASQLEEDFQCGICSASFNSKANLLEHVQLKHGRRNKKLQQQQNQPKTQLKSCSDCGANFRNDFDLYKHRRNGCQDIQQVEQNMPENIIQENQLKLQSAVNQCSDCGLNFKFRIQLVKHKKLHDNLQENPTENAVVSLNESIKLTQSERKKFGDQKSFACPKPGCGFRSQFQGSIKGHLKCTHGEGAKIFKCDLCPFQTALKGNLRQHERSHSSEKPFACSFKDCYFRTRWVSNLRVHLALHEKKNQGQELGHQKFHRPKKFTKRSTPKISPGQTDCVEESEKSVQRPRALSRQPSLLHNSLCEELQNQDFKMQTDKQQPLIASQDLLNTEMLMPKPPGPSDTPEPRISQLISPDEPTEETELIPPPAAAARNQAQKPCQKLKKKSINGARLKRKPSASAVSFQCPHCPYRARMQWHLRGHLVGHGAAEPFSCPIKNCDFQTKWQNLLYSHMRNVHSTPYIPPGSKQKLQTLKKISKSSGNVKQPKKLATTTASPPPSVKPPIQSPGHAVKVTSTSKSTENVVPKHWRKNPESKMFLCPLPDCGFKTRYDNNMPRHLELHEKIRSFSYNCPNCRGKFANAPALGRHKRTCRSHVQRPPSPAPGSSSSSALETVKVFKRQKGVITLYSCTVPDCNFKTRFRPSFFGHQQTHEKYGVFAHACANCPRRYATMGALRRHGPKCARIIASNQAATETKSLKSTRVIPVGQTAKKNISLELTPITPASQTCAKVSNKALKSAQEQSKFKFTCPVPDCNFKTRLRACALVHQRNHNKYGNFSHNCTGCHRKFATSAALLRHRPKCTRIIPANQTNKTDSTVNSSTASTRQDGQFYTCAIPNCNYKTHLKASLHIHRQRHKKYGKFKHNCAGCQRKFATAAALRRHGHQCPTGIQASQTSGTSSSGNSSASKTSKVQHQGKDRWYTCAVADCNFKTIHRGHMWHHKRSHLKYGNFAHTCADCKRKFATAAVLLRHRNKSTGNCSSLQRQQQPYEAKVIHAQAKVKQQKASPKLQASVGKGSKTLKCPDCPYETTKKRYLNRHSSIHLAKAHTLKCPQCPYLARDQWHFNRHSMSHTDERPYPCALCPYTGRYSWRLKEHHQRHHPGRKFSPLPKVSVQRSCAKKAPANNHRTESHASETLAHNTATLNHEDSAPNGCTFCSYMSRLAKYLTKHMTTTCPGCQKLTNQSQSQVLSSTSPQVVPSSTLAADPQVPSQSPAALLDQVPNFACMLCGYVAASESHALDHSRVHKSAIVALERLSVP